MNSMSLAAAPDLKETLPGILGRLTGNPSREALERLKRNARKYSAHSLVLQESEETDRVFVVFDGWLSASKSLENGEIQIIDFILPGDVVEPVSADGATAGVSLDAVTDATVATMSLSAWQELLEHAPELDTAVGTLRAASRTRISERLLRIGKGSASTRIAYALLELCVRLRTLGHETTHLPLSQKDIGDFTGLSSVHVCRTMRRLVRHNVIETSHHLDVKILDLDSLTDIAGIDVDRLQREIAPLS